MFRRIVCATDFSETAAVAARHAASVARAFHGSLELVHAWSLPADVAADLTMGASVITEAKQASHRKLADAASLVGMHAETRLLEGAADLTLVEHARVSGADLLVTGTLGRTGLAHVLMGSVAERVVRTSSVPVLTVPRATRVVAHESFSPTVLLVPVDLGAASAEMLRTAFTLATATHGRVCAVYAWDVPFYFAARSELLAEVERAEHERFEDWCRATLGGANARVERIARRGAAADMIADVAREQSAELIVMATAGRTGTERFLVGSVTERVLRTVGVPVLTFRRPPETGALELAET